MLYTRLAYGPFFILAICTVLMACGAQPTSPPPAASPSVQPGAVTEPSVTPEATAGVAQPDTQAVTGELVIYTSRAEALFKPVVASFNAMFPKVKVTVLTGKNNELGAKILEEQAHPVADIFINTDNLSMADLAAQGAFAPNPSSYVMAVPERYRADDGSWVALTLRPRVIMYNTELVKADELPSSVMDLTDPKWKGQIGAADSTNGAMMAHLAALGHLKGQEAAATLVQGLVANETTFFGGHTEVRKAVGAGELKLGFVNHYYYHLSKAEGAPVGIIYPDQGADQIGLIVNTTNAAIVKAAPHAQLAGYFIDFMLSPDGQKVYAEQNFEYPIIAGVTLADGVPALSDFKLADVSLKSMYAELATTREMAQKAGLP